MTAAALTLANVQLGIHAPIRHGVDAAAGVSAMFNTDGTCNRGPSAEIKGPYGVWMNLCFHDDGASAWFTSDRMNNPASREVTTIPREQMSKPIQYLRSVFSRGYDSADIVYHGDAPEWFTGLIKELIKNGVMQ